jgi:YD repeat-containing protein
MRTYALLLILVVSSALHAQELRVEPGTEDPTTLRFNEAFIQRNGVLSIEGQGNIKREGEPIRQKNEGSEYRFAPTGRLINSNTSYSRNNSAPDTSHVTYVYDAQGRLLEQQRNDRSGRFAERDSLDSDGRCVRRTHVRIQEPVTGGYALMRTTETVISDERFTHEAINDTAVRTTWHNEHGLPYREQVFQKDRWGYLRAIEDRNIITGRRGLITFRYDEKGRLAERIERSDISAPPMLKHVWRYDNTGNVTLCDAWRDDRQIRHSEYLYEEGTLLLKAIIAKDMETGLIHITRYTTQRK